MIDKCCTDLYCHAEERSISSLILPQSVLKKEASE